MKNFSEMQDGSGTIIFDLPPDMSFVTYAKKGEEYISLNAFEVATVFAINKKENIKEL